MQALSFRARILSVSVNCLHGFPPAAATAFPQDIPIGATYVCSGEHIYVENCNTRDLSDNANCMVAHPDHLTPTGKTIRTPTSLRGALEETAAHLPAALLAGKQDSLPPRLSSKSSRTSATTPTCKRPKQQMKAPSGNQQLTNLPAAVAVRSPPGRKTPEERAMRRCVSSWASLPSSCTGNSLLGAFGQMISLGASLRTGRRQTAYARPEHGWSLSGRRQLAARLYRRRCARQLFVPFAQPVRAIFHT